MVILRRVLVLAALAFWQGGFTFYSVVVIHAGHEVLSVRMQGFVTRRVTDYLNVAGAIALPLLAWDIASTRPGSGRRVRWLCWAGMAGTLAVLIGLHVRLNAMLDPSALDILNRSEFYPMHRWYLHASTVQWGCALVYGVLAVRDWREEDRSLSCPV